MKNNAEVVIIGGGIIGCATAYYLAKEGVSVIVLEKSDHIGNGGSSRNGGGVRQSGRDPRELPLAMYAVEHMWPTLSEELGVDVEYHKEGNLRLGKTAKHKEILQGLTDRAVALGLDVRMIDGKEVREINPYLSEEITVASWCPTDGHANPLVATLGFYKRARELGAEFITGEDVLEIQKIKGKARRVVTEKNVYEGETIVLASGYESRPIAASVGIDIPMRKELIEALVTEAEPKMFPQMLGTADADFYGHQTNHGSFVFGGASGFEAENRDNGHMITSSITAPCICRGNYPQLAKLAGKLPLFPIVHNQRSMLYIENLAQFVKRMIDNEETGVFFPQNEQYINTSDLVQMIAVVKGHRLVMVPATGWIIRLMKKIPGKIGTLTGKAFGDSVYDMQMSEYKEEYRVCDWKESVRRTEG